eukprot:1667160-Amphidinium_carterae.1
MGSNLAGPATEAYSERTYHNISLFIVQNHQQLRVRAWSQSLTSATQKLSGIIEMVCHRNQQRVRCEKVHIRMGAPLNSDSRQSLNISHHLTLERSRADCHELFHISSCLRWPMGLYCIPSLQVSGHSNHHRTSNPCMVKHVGFTVRWSNTVLKNFASEVKDPHSLKNLLNEVQTPHIFKEESQETNQTQKSKLLSWTCDPITPRLSQRGVKENKLHPRQTQHPNRDEQGTDNKWAASTDNKEPQTDSMPEIYGAHALVCMTRGESHKLSLIHI